MTTQKQPETFLWTKEGYKKALYCYYCKANSTPTNRVNPNGYGCSNCKNYAETRSLEIIKL